MKGMCPNERAERYKAAGRIRKNRLTEMRLKFLPPADHQRDPLALQPSPECGPNQASFVRSGVDTQRNAIMLSWPKAVVVSSDYRQQRKEILAFLCNHSCLCCIETMIIGFFCNTLHLKGKEWMA